MPEIERYSQVTFPELGVDLSGEFSEQRPQTTRLGNNVRFFESLTLRGRGGSRPGLFRFIPTQVNGAERIQDLNLIVITDQSALVGSPDFPDGIDDPSDQGPPETWGSGTITDDSFPPITALDERSRNPGGPGSSGHVKPRKVRNGGNARQPNKNSKRPRRPDSLDPALLGITPRFKFAGFAEYSYDYNLTGSPQHTSATFTGATCYPYRPAVGIGPPPSLTPDGLPTLNAAKNAYFASIAYQNPTGITLVRTWWESADSNGRPLPTGVCNCADIHTFGGYDGGAGNNVPCPEGT